MLLGALEDAIDLNDPKVFRDLSKPVGALDPARLQQFIERYNLLAEDPDAHTPPFHYGSHYSSSGIVLFFLLRMEPFTALSRQLQGGRFDQERKEARRGGARRGRARAQCKVQ